MPFLSCSFGKYSLTKGIRLYTLITADIVYKCIRMEAKTIKSFDGRVKDDKHHVGGHKGGRHCHGAQTFRRGRALEFLDRLTVKRNTLKQQLDAPEFQEIKLMLQGELKALELVIDEYSRHFDLSESTEVQEPEREEDKS